MTRSVRILTLAGLLAALALALSVFESLMFPVFIPGVRVGLANVAVTAAVVLTGVGCGCGVAVVKVLFVCITRGVTGGLLCAAGTLSAFLITLALLPLVRRGHLSYVGVSISAAALHTAGQLTAASILLSSAVMAFASLALAASVINGALTGLILNHTIPRFPVSCLGKDE